MPRFIQPQAGDRGVASGVEHRLTLQGCGVLIVEDEAMVAMLLGGPFRTLINGVRVRDCRSLRGRKNDQCHSREGLFLVSQFHWHLPLP